MSLPPFDFGGVWDRKDDLIISFVIVSAVCLFGHFIRWLIKTGKLKLRDWLRRTLLEALGTLETCVFAFELNYIIYDNYPIWVYIASIFMFSIYQNMDTNFDLRVDGNPVETFRSWYGDEVPWDYGIMYTLSQLVGAAIPFYLIITPAWNNSGRWTFWSSASGIFSNYHKAKISTGTWVTAVLEKNPSLSFLSEGILTFFTYISAKYIRSLSFDNKMEICVIALSNALAYAIGSSYSGSYSNPAVATAQELMLTSGVAWFTKIVVYWIAPILGVLCFTYAEQYI